MGRGLWIGISVVVAGAVALAAARPLAPRSGLPTRPGPQAPAPLDVGVVESAERSSPHAFRIPSGAPSMLGCEAARRVVSQVRAHLAYEPEPVQDAAFAVAVGDWLDPYGLWSAAPDTPVARKLPHEAHALVAELQARSGGCPAARAIGRTLVPWADELRRVFDRGRADAPDAELETLVLSAVFESGPVTRPARTLAALLGKHVGSLERSLGRDAGPYVRAARERYFPELDAEAWSRVVLAAEVRAYVALVDPHGAWAPADEEASVYEIDLEAHPPSRLWERSARTVLGVRAESRALAPLRDGDIVLSLGGVVTAGLPLEQLDQLTLAMAQDQRDVPVTVLRLGDARLKELSVRVSGQEGDAVDEAEADELPTERVGYGEGDVLVVSIREVRDNLGELLSRTLARARDGQRRALVGLALDLRGNGGGSTDGAIDALGLFLPGAPLFPMRRRDGTIETDRAPEPPLSERWTGPVAAVVDEETASAAEMIAGALGAYHRGPVVGTTTFGKGCAQEYLEDDTQSGVLRLTTLLYALPDGTPVQRVGLKPTYRFAFAERASEREAMLPHAAPTWRGPDVRDLRLLKASDERTNVVRWPALVGALGPCQHPEVCRALRTLGGVQAGRRASAAKIR